MIVQLVSLTLSLLAIQASEPLDKAPDQPELVSASESTIETAQPFFRTQEALAKTNWQLLCDIDSIDAPPEYFKKKLDALFNKVCRRCINSSSKTLTLDAVCF
jgi:hypothetical protein